MFPCWLQRRLAGVLLHPTSLPHPDGQGDLGPAACRFVDYLATAGFSVWQMLPIGPVHADRSPYLARSSLAGHTGLISATRLREQGLLDRKEAAGSDDLPERRNLLRLAWQTFQRDADSGQREQFRQFVEAQADWLHDYALFRALGRLHGGRPWPEWPKRHRSPDAAARAHLWRTLDGTLADDLELECFGQYLFFEQWAALRIYAAARGIELYGDLPIYVAHDSVDMWRHPELFHMDAAGRPSEVAGVPPDAFAPEGQRWGNPLHDWQRQAADGYHWWIRRLQQQYALFDLLRLDHFRGFEAYWAIPAEAPGAAQGQWRPGPGQAFFDQVIRAMGPLRLVAEDLGSITPAVNALRQQNGFPGMRVLQFGFEGGADNPHRPANHSADTVVYTGTHDNDTILGWWENLADAPRDEVQALLGDRAQPTHCALAAVALASPARLAMLPMQDLLGLGRQSRMNVPGTAHGNWRWQLPEGVVESGPEAWIAPLLHDSGRKPA